MQQFNLIKGEKRMLKVLQVISKKEFNKISKDTKVDIIGFSVLEKYTKKHEKYKRIRKMNYVNNKDYVVTDDIGGITYKYADLGSNNYIAIKLPLLAILIPLLILLMLIGLVGFILLDKDTSNKIILDNGVEIDLNKQPMVGEQEGIAMPGLGISYILTAEQPVFNLINPENNTVYFKYKVKANKELIYETEWITPNRMIEANLWEILEAGTYDLDLDIETLDCLTETPCTTSSLSTKLVIQK